MKKSALKWLAGFGLILPLMLGAQEAAIDFNTQHQLIRGFGGVNMPSWINDLSEEEVEKAFGTQSGQLGFSILRIKVPSSKTEWEREVRTAKQAKDLGALLFATPWSPPAALKSNLSIVSGELLPRNYGVYAQYLSDFYNFMAEKGAELYAISLQNEPDYKVDYESCNWSPAQMIDFLKNHASVIPGKMIAPESFQFRREQSDPILNDPKASAEVDIVGGHIYGGGLFSYPLAERKGKEVWMTEHLVLETDWESVLATGKEIHDCMLSNYNAYVWWYIRRFYGPLDERGNVSKRGYVMSHFSRFIRPNFYRVQAQASPVPRVSLSAYRDLETAVVVMINQTAEPKSMTLALSGGEFSTFERYETTVDQSVVLKDPVKVVKNAVSITLPASSITTLTGRLIPKTSYTNPILPGDHPDMTLLKHGEDFYLSGSNFHRAPFGTILHSKDMVRWRTLTHVVPANWSELASDAPSFGTWQGVITYFYGSFWYYFSNTAGGGQYFCKATAPEGPWSKPVRVMGTASTGNTGYDNSIFVDEDGTPWLLIKAGRYTNRIQRIGAEGHLVGEAINLDWMNANGRYSWAEGPVMCKKDGWYYYFVAGNVSGGQWVLRSKTLTADPASWQEMGPFFAPVTDPATGFRGPNHITAPLKLDDGTWWTISHSYERTGSSDWNGLGRQGLLHQVTWDDNGKPTGAAPTSLAVPGPNLLSAGIPLKITKSDEFEDLVLAPWWYFIERAAASKYSLSAIPGSIRLNPGTGKTHLLQKIAEHSCRFVTKVTIDAVAPGQRAGLYLTNGNQSLTIEVYSGYNSGKILGINFFGNLHEIPNTVGKTVWLRVDKVGHLLSVYTSPDGKAWSALIENVATRRFDAEQPNFNSWIGNSLGLFAHGVQADFDFFRYNPKLNDVEVWLEAECGAIGSMWQISQDATASNARYAAVRVGNNSTSKAPADATGHINYTFEVQESGLYQLWGRFICPTANDDSFWVKMNGGDWILWNGIAPGATVWTWDKLGQSFTLTEGSHTLTIGYREDGARVDKWHLSRSGARPDGIGGKATNCIQ